ncbi:MAG: UbiD family decarboxylase, partial [Deltaproteobacteria bacterium]|nr:UbiD family decarboxylase [Deltaproteobacteria bacterium]
MPKDLQSFLSFLGKERPDALCRVKAPVDPNVFEATALLKLLERRGSSRVVLFENVKDMKSSPSAFPLLYNLFASRSLCASAIGLAPTADRMELTHELSRLEQRPGATEVVAAREAPVKQNVLAGERADLRCLPIGIHHKLDVGPYLTMICVMKSPKGKFYDMTFTKNMV